MKQHFLKAFNLLSVVVLAVAILLTMFSVMVTDEAIAAWDGSTQAFASSGKGTESQPYVISTEKQLGYFLSQIKNGVTYEGQYLYLAKDLDMTGGTWDLAGYTFQGTLDGRGYTIKAECAFLGTIGENATVRGLNYNCTAEVDRSIFCLENAGNINNCVVKGNADGGSRVGMFCSTNSGTIRKCGAIGSAKAYGDDTSAYAGMVAYNNSGAVIEDCYAAITASASHRGKYNYNHYGPIVGYKYGTVTNCFYDKTLYTATTEYGTGMTTAELKSNNILGTLRGDLPEYCDWTIDAALGGYPRLAHLAHNYRSYVTGYDGQELVAYDGTYLYVTLSKSTTYSSAEIYYTTNPNETNPSNFTRYTSGSIRLSGDSVITTAVKYNSSFGALTRQRFVSLPGAGTEASPYKISTKSQLTLLHEFPTAHFELVADLTFTAADFATDGVCPGGWVAVPSFSGVLCGNGHAITGLQGKHGGLIGTNNGTICDLRIVNHRLYGPGDVGAVANSNGYQTGVVTRCYTSSAYSLSSLPATPAGPVSSVGGVVGYNSGTVSYCRNDGVVAHINNGSYITGELGGIVGYGDASNCVNTGQLIMINNATLENIYVGGITGGGDARNCMSNCDVYLDVRADYPFSVAGLAGGLSYNWAYNSVAGINVTRVGNTAQGHSVYAYACGVQSGSTNCYQYKSYNLPEDCPNLDFGVGGNWWISNDGLVPQGVMGADGHAWRLTSSQILPTCAANGDAVLKCDICGQTSLKTIYAVDHKFTTYTSNNDGTCVADGTKTSTCDRNCGYAGSTTTVAEENSINPNGHTFQDGVCTLCGIMGGQCGDDLYWSLKEGKLTIYGTGAMYDYQYNTMPWYDHRESITSVTVEAGATYLGNNAFRGMTALTSVSINVSVTEIGYSAFEGCSALSAIALPANMTVIADSLFHSCTSLTTITLPTKLETIGVNAFNSCAMTSISLPSTLKEIDHYAFAGCSRLKSIYFPSSLTSIGGGVFQNCSSLTSVTVPASVTSMGTGVFSRCSALTSATINANITSLPAKTFELCSALQTVKLPAGLTSIGVDVFSSCINLTSVNIPSGVTSIGSAAFSGCSKLPSVTLPSGLKTIESNTFYGCRAFTELVIPDGVTTIGMNAFSGCSGLTYAVLPRSLLTINARGFLDCDALTDIYFGGSETAWTDIGSEVPVAERIHYECTDVANHWLTVVTDPSCTKIGYTSDLCLCDPCYEKDVRNEVAATGHAWVDADCLVAKTCATCGETEGEPLSPNLEHTWAAATCTLPETCSVCNATQGEELGHDWLSATCTAAAPCSRCDATYGSPLGHDWKAADCENPETCSRCGNTRGAALGHRIVQEDTKLVDPVTVKNNTMYPFTLTGGTWYSTNHSAYSSADLTIVADHACSLTLRYGVSSESNYDKLSILVNNVQKAAISGSTTNQTLTFTLVAGDQVIVRYAKDGSVDNGQDRGWVTLTYSQVEVTTSTDIPAADVEAECTEEVTCAYCDTVVKPATEHSWENATCTTVAKCTVCGATDGDVLGHDWQDADCDTPETCSRCGTTQGNPLGHDWLPADCLTSKTCDRCGVTDGEPLGHRVVEVRETWVDPVRVENASGVPFQLIDGTYYSNNHTNSSSSQIRITADYACSLTLHYGVSSEANYDKLFILHNNTQKDMISGSVANKTLTLQLAVGDTVIVRYTKDTSQNRYDDRGWATLKFDRVLLSSTNVDVPAEEVEADCVTPVICDYCHTEVKPAAEHSWIPATCLAPKTCDVCGATEGEIGDHSWKKATCIAPETCEVCGETQGEIDPRNHNFSGGVCLWCGFPGGQCGNRMYWLMEDEDSLVIYGTGSMYDYMGDPMPWATHAAAIRDVTVESGVAGLDDAAFANLGQLQKATITGTVTELPSALFKNCAKLTEVNLEEGTTGMLWDCFMNCTGLETLVLPEGFQSVSMFTFGNCTGLKTLVIPESMTYIEVNAFEGTGPDLEIYYAGTSDEWDVLIHCDTQPVQHLDDNFIHYECTEPNGHWQTTVVEPACEAVGYTCERCGCDPYYEKNIRDEVPAVGHAWKDANCTIPETCETCGATQGQIDPRGHIFVNGVCTECGIEGGQCGENLHWIYAGDVVTVYGTGEMYDYKTHTIPWYHHCNTITAVVLEEGVTTIGAHAFEGLMSLEQVSLPQGLTDIGDFAFFNCALIGQLNIPGSVQMIHGFAFANSGVTALIMESGVRYIEGNAFANCGRLEAAAIPNGTISINAQAFYDCDNLKLAVIPASVTTFGNDIFAECEKLEDVYFGGTEEQWPANQNLPYGRLHYNAPSSDGHWRWGITVEADCLNGGYTRDTCPCGHEMNIRNEVPALGHTGGTATCTQQAVCTRCGVSYGEKLNHNWLAATCVASETCKNCGATRGEKLSHTGGTATCTQQAICDRCGKGYGEVSGQHQFDAIWHSGDAGHWHVCTVCGTKDTVMSHNPGPAATESSAQTCLDCGYVIQQKLEHVHDLKQVTYKAAKCEDDGNIEYYTCECGQWFLEAYAQTLITDHSTVILPATGHKHVKTSTVPATCNAAGYSIYTCTCGDSYEADHVSALGHTGGTATCEQPARCTRCGELYGEKLDHVFDFESDWLPGNENGHWHECVNCGTHEPPIPHIPGPEATEDTAQTCTECGYVIAPALGHTHKLTHKSFVEPTCTKDGSKEYFACTCGKWFTDGEAENEITDHSSVVIPAKGHSHSQQVTKPTCTEDGYTTYTCSCGDTYTADIVKAPGHQYDEGVCTECGAVDETYVPKFEISFANMTLGNSLAMNFAFEQGHRQDWNGCYAQIVKEYADGRSDKVVTIPYSQWGTAKISGVQHFTLKFDGVAAKEMSDNVYVTIYDASGKAISKVWEDSVRSYAMRTLNNPSSNLETQIMIVDLLNYGAAAQSNFGYNTADLANNQLSAAQKALATKTVKATDGRVKGANYKGTNLGLESQILMRMAFSGTTEDMYAIISFTSHTGKENNIRVEGSEFGTSGVIVIDEIVIADGRQPVTITVYNADGSVHGYATDSLESYIARMSDAGALYEMILKFSDSAYNFFH